MRRYILLFLLLPLALFALDITDPLGEIYDDIQVWHEAGLIDTLPSLRPYPAQVLVAALEEVTARTSLSGAERARARKYLDELTGTDIDLVWGGEAQLKSGEDEEYLWGIAGMDFNTWFNDYIALNGRWVAMAKYEGDGYYAGGEAGPIDTFDDNAEASIRGRTIELRQILTNSFSVGSDSLYFQAGHSPQLLRTDIRQRGGPRRLRPLRPDLQRHLGRGREIRTDDHLHGSDRHRLLRRCRRPLQR